MKARRYAQGFALGTAGAGALLFIASAVSGAILNRRIEHAMEDMRSQIAARRLTAALTIMGRRDFDPATRLELARQLVPDFPDPSEPGRG